MHGSRHTPLHAPLHDLIEQAASPGTARVRVPPSVPTDISQLLRTPTTFGAHVCGLEKLITPALRALAAMRDPVADAHAGWIMTVLAAAAGVPIEPDAALAAPGSGQLTPEGRAWLKHQTIECAATDLQRDRIAAASGIKP